MQERLDFIKLQPRQWAHWEPVRGGLQAHKALQQRYAQADVWLSSAQKTDADWAEKALKATWWQPVRWTGPSVHTGVPPESSVQMVWANMQLHASAQPQALLQSWHRALAVDGFLMFSCMGPDTLRELRHVYAQQGWPAPAHEFTDMHDWGDMLVQAGFAEPVMDMERITLTFETPERLLAELRELGRNLNIRRFAGLRGRRWLAQLHAALLTLAQVQEGGRLALSFEIVYGHALKPQPRAKVMAETEIGLAQMRQMLKR
jgi:malonyl-CoA O-methyltransferase